MSRLDPILCRWRMFAILASASLLAIAHGFERFGGYAPCLLCLKQREVYWAALGLGAAFMVLVRLPGGPRWREATCWVLGTSIVPMVTASSMSGSGKSDEYMVGTMPVRSMSMWALSLTV